MLVKHSTITDKVYFEHPEFRDIKVPFKKISQTDTISENGNFKNPDLIVYDTSGPLSDPDFKADTKGIKKYRKDWIKNLDSENKSQMHYACLLYTSPSPRD